MAFNALTDLNLIQKWQLLTSLNLMHCSITNPVLISAGESVFKNLKDLEKLILSNNNLTGKPSDFLTGLVNLRFLDLSNNKIELLSMTFFQNLNKLINLHLNHNKLKSIQPFLDLVNLQILTVTHNEITELQPDDGFVNLQNLTELYLDFNQLNTDIGTIKWPPKAVLISVSNNKLHSNGNQQVQFPSTAKRVNFNSNQLTDLSGFRIPKGTVVDVSRNSINYISSNIIQTVNSYQIILKDNPLICDCKQKEAIEYFLEKHLTAVTARPKSPVSNVSVQFPDDDLKCMNQNGNSSFINIKLETLCKVFCPMFCICNPPYSNAVKNLECIKLPVGMKFEHLEKLTLNSVSFESLQDLQSEFWMNLTTLQIYQANGSINSLTNFSLGYKPALLEFSFTNSKLKYFTGTVLKRVENLRVLNLSMNEFELVPSDLLGSNVKLQKLDLSFNNLTNIPNEFFSNLIQLDFVDLSSNKLNRISSNLFKTNSKITLINLRDNRITSFESDSFQHLNNLFQLDMSQNFIGKEEFSAAKWPVALKNLNISRNKIVDFDFNWKFLRDLVNLDVSFNSIQKIDIENFLGYSSQTVLNLENNKISEIQFNSESELYGNKPLLKLKNNPLHCNCELKWLLQCLKSLQCPLRFDESVSCQTPKQLESRFLLDLNFNQLQCDLPNCSSGCRCFKIAADSPEYVFEVNCSNGHLVAFPNVSIGNVSVLILDGNENVSLAGLKDSQWKNLSRFSANSCKFLEISRDLLWENSNLQFLQMADGGIHFIPNEFFRNLSALLELDLSKNKIKALYDGMFSGLVNLQVLNLNSNKIKLIDSNVFIINKNILTLDLSRNEIPSYPQFPESLYHLNLSSNKLISLPDSEMTLRNLTSFDLSNNKLTSVNLTDFQDVYSNLTIILDYNSIIEFTLPKEKVQLTANIHHNPISCDCSLHENLFPELTILTDQNCEDQFDSIYSRNVCKVRKNCKECTCIKDMTTGNVTMNCRYSGLTAIPELAPENVTSLNLDNNNITILKGLDNINWENLTILTVNNNQISKLQKENLPDNLLHVSLAGNLLSEPSGWLLQITKNEIPAVSLQLGRNPWLCSCSNEFFSTWLLNDKQRYIKDLFNITCKGQDILLINATLCTSQTNWKTFGPALISMLVFLVFVIGVLVFYCRHKQAVCVFLYGHGLLKLCVVEDEIDRDKEYDAFVSYAGEDEEFVMEHLVPELEEKEPRFKLCLHERDWKLGEQIIDQIELSVEKSRRVIIILSKNFVNSMWSSIEFKTAHYHCIKDKINRIIIVVLDELPSKDDMDPDLKMHINLNTYLKWKDPKFSQKLRFALTTMTFRRKSKIKRKD